MYPGKDGIVYNTWDEMRKANVRWEQQEKQNRLLEEQNRMLQEQQIREQIRELGEKLEAKAEQMRIEYQQRYEIFESKWQSEIYPLMIKAKIKEPAKYHENLQELYYNSKPEPKFPKIPNVKNIKEARYIFSKIAQNDDIYLHQDEYNLIMKDIRKIVAPLNRISTKYIIITLFLCITPFLLASASGNNILIFLSFILALFIAFTSIFFYRKEVKNNPKLDSKKIVSEVNNYIDKKNIENRKEVTEWENKIKNYENKRLNNFNYLLEIALEELSIAESELMQSDINYKLQFNDYPSDYIKKKNEYFNKKNLNQAIQDGTEDFLNL